MIHQLYIITRREVIRGFKNIIASNKLQKNIGRYIVILYLTILASTSKKPQFSQASFISSMVAPLSSPLSFSMSITGKVSILSSIFFLSPLALTSVCFVLETGYLVRQFIAWRSGKRVKHAYVVGTYEVLSLKKKICPPRKKRMNFN
jgi:hypothetical protein